MSFGASDAVSFVLHTAINGLAERQNVIANDIANVDTPGYRASSVDFETALKSAIAGGSANGDIQATVTPDQTPVGANGNNVDLRKEELASIQTQYQYQVVGEAISNRADLMRAVTAM
ncbi:MAG: flagellar basal body rod protein FlgB [Nocardioidaceae bacterium]|nr:flagellar basal body rod protein FlgB [Nocardioidaceae bacterium]MCL2613291.1 flagellar basal body rod protein FlgB [Nocardioidaceae bacterium]